MIIYWKKIPENEYKLSVSFFFRLLTLTSYSAFEKYVTEKWDSFCLVKIFLDVLKNVEI